MTKRNAPKRHRNYPRTAIVLSNPTPTAAESCEQCRLAHRRLRFSLTLDEAKRVVAALDADIANYDLQQYVQAHLTIASRPDSYQYDC